MKAEPCLEKSISGMRPRMPEMTKQRIPFSHDATIRLRTLKSRTGVTPNVLCRIGYCLSLDEPGTPQAVNEQDLDGIPIGRFTLLGEHDALFISLLIAWMQENNHNDFDEDTVNGFFLAHVHRGVEIIYARVKTLIDLERLAS